MGDLVFGRTVLDDVKEGSKTLVKVGATVSREMVDLINQSTKLDSVQVRSPITCKTLYGICSKCYGLDLGRNKQINIGEAIGVIAAQSISEPGTQLTMRTFHIGGLAGTDITHGLPRVEELFEARIPKGKAFLAEEDGVVEAIDEKRLVKSLSIKSTGEKKKKGKLYEFAIPHRSDIYFKVGDKVKKGDQLCEGNLDIKELFQLRDIREVERYIINEIQEVYSSQGESIDNKHIEVVVKQMFSRVKIKDSGSSKFIVGDIIEKAQFITENRRIKELGGEPAKAQQLLMGITKVALSTESFLSAASFIETAKVLINAAVEGKTDILRGLKENVIIGRLIPVGSGLESRKKIAENNNEEETE
ncbi:MAG: hypothetical protein ABH822_01495 [Patescibacteria group bacterium]